MSDPAEFDRTGRVSAHQLGTPSKQSLVQAKQAAQKLVSDLEKLFAEAKGADRPYRGRQLAAAKRELAKYDSKDNPFAGALTPIQYIRKDAALDDLLSLGWKQVPGKPGEFVKGGKRLAKLNGRWAVDGQPLLLNGKPPSSDKQVVAALQVPFTKDSGPIAVRGRPGGTPGGPGFKIPPRPGT